MGNLTPRMFAGRSLLRPYKNHLDWRKVSGAFAGIRGSRRDFEAGDDCAFVEPSVNGDAELPGSGTREIHCSGLEQLVGGLLARGANAAGASVPTD